MDYTSKRRIVERTKKLKDYEYVHLFRIIKQSSNSKYSSNKNGIFINLKNLDDTTLKDIEDYLDFVEGKDSIINKKDQENEAEQGKKKTKIIVEQSSDDSDDFEPNTNVVFVKRVSRKKKEPVVEHVKEPQLEMELPPPERSDYSNSVIPPRPPPRPELTPQQRVLKSQYESMFSGGFMNQNNLMRRHY